MQRAARRKKCSLNFPAKQQCLRPNLSPAASLRAGLFNPFDAGKVLLTIR